MQPVNISRPRTPEEAAEDTVREKKIREDLIKSGAIKPEFDEVKIIPEDKSS